MKSILLVGITVVMMALSMTVAADKAHHEDKDGDPKQSMSSTMHSGGMGMMDMDAMHKQMAKMQKTMKKIHNSKDPKAQKELMRQHMQEMHKGMGMMSGEMMKKMPKKMQEPMAMMDADDEMADLKTIHKRQQMAEQRMGVMQGMMMQMMQHMMQQQAMGMAK
ncbi:MAG: hypothetical protein GXP21_03755 [Gammaproteobacteria bacterium]|nr:hypothetical protein [Gammaproteobacteria bacterium]